MFDWFFNLFEPSEKQLSAQMIDIIKHLKVFSNTDNNYFSLNIPNKDTNGGIRLNYFFDKVDIFYVENLNRKSLGTFLFEIRFSSRGHVKDEITKSKKIKEEETYNNLRNLVKILKREEERLKELYYKETQNVSKMLENFR